MIFAQPHATTFGFDPRSHGFKVAEGSADEFRRSRGGWHVTKPSAGLPDGPLRELVDLAVTVGNLRFEAGDICRALSLAFLERNIGRIRFGALRFRHQNRLAPDAHFHFRNTIANVSRGSR